eukprot:2153410-Prymnesium_polylepis.1
MHTAQRAPARALGVTRRDARALARREYSERDAARGTVCECDASDAALQQCITYLRPPNTQEPREILCCTVSVIFNRFI